MSEPKNTRSRRSTTPLLMLSKRLRKLKEELTLEARLRQFRGQDAAAARPTDAAVARPTSSAEYLAGRVRRHPARATLAGAAALLLVGSLVALPFLA